LPLLYREGDVGERAEQKASGENSGERKETFHEGNGADYDTMHGVASITFITLSLDKQIENT
jgi:hypothetical protein